MTILLDPITKNRTAKPAPARRLSLASYLAQSEGPPFYEYEDGELISMVQPHGRHQEILTALLVALHPHVLTKKLGKVWPEVDVILRPQARVYVPDVTFVKAENLNRYRARDGKIHGAPDLVVEILSPSTQQRDRTTKLRSYQQAGVPWYWIVDQNFLTIEEYRLTEQGYLVAQAIEAGQPFRPGLFPELVINLAGLLGIEVVESGDDE